MTFILKIDNLILQHSTSSSLDTSEHFQHQKFFIDTDTNTIVQPESTFKRTWFIIAS